MGRFYLIVAIQLSVKLSMKYSEYFALFEISDTNCIALLYVAKPDHLIQQPDQTQP